MDPKLYELFNQLQLIFQHFSEAMQQANAPGPAGAPQPQAIVPAPGPQPGAKLPQVAPGDDAQIGAAQRMSDEELDDKLKVPAPKGMMP